jgi:hypothetical protein
MAKGKNAAALFEVIQAAKQKEQLRAKGGGFLTPSWWFKGRARTSGAPTPQQPAPAKAASIAPAPVLNRARAIPEPITSGPDVEPETHTVSDPTAAFINPSEAPGHQLAHNEEPAIDDPEFLSDSPAASTSDDAADDTATLPAMATAPAQSPAAARTFGGVKRRPVDVGVDRAQQQINFRLTYTSAAISSFALLVVVGLAFLIGKSIGRGPAPAGAASIDAVKNGEAFPDVLKVSANGKATANEEGSISVSPPPKPVATPPAQQPANGKPGPAMTKAPDPIPAAPPQQTSANGKRIVGMQYVLMQSYPDPEDAKEAAEALNKAGIPVTVEKGFYYAPGWSCVIGTRPFERTKNNPEFTAYMKSIEDVSKSFAGTSRFRRFEPRPLAWK